MDIDRIFKTSSESTHYFFSKPGEGFYIPVYQRDYSWDEENIEQLMDDVRRGVKDLISSTSSEETIHFMGTIILVAENNPENNISPQDPKALPAAILNVIDGQQRILTFSLLGCKLYELLHQSTQKLPKSNNYDDLREITKSYLTKLKELFTLCLGRGYPEQKPVIIRASVDTWTLEDDDDKCYKSNVSWVLAQFIRAIADESEFPRLTRKAKTKIHDNFKIMDDYLQDVLEAHKSDGDAEYPRAWEILEGNIKQKALWDYDRPGLKELVEDRDEQTCSLVQLYTFCYYLLERCCFTIIKPVSEVRAFDMFQSLNATGTPLTALETFKPLVVNTAEFQESEGSNKNSYANSKFKSHFDRVDDLMERLKSASTKNARTNDYLTLFAVAYKGEKLSKQFSKQRKWLNHEYAQCKAPNDKENFVRAMGYTASYCKQAIYSEANQRKGFPELDKIDEPLRKEAAFLTKYLQDAGHKMAYTILSRFYSVAITDSSKQKEFALACKSIAAFFTLWRSSISNKGLDDVYRKLLAEHMSWKCGDSSLNIPSLQEYLWGILKSKNIGDKESWKVAALQYLRYDNVTKVCKFCLFVTASNTICDPDSPGLMKVTQKIKDRSYLVDPEKWKDSDLKDIEHIAPQNPNSDPFFDSWDSQIYDNSNYNSIGNLTLLPNDINSSASNKSWMEKWFYYKYLSEKDSDNLPVLKKEAEEKGIFFKDDVLKRLESISCKDHILPLTKVEPPDYTWNQDIINKRADRICDIVWETMSSWLSVQDETEQDKTDS